MLIDDYFTCPVCGTLVDLHHRSPEFDREHWPGFWRGDGRRKGICEQLDASGERVMVHFAVEVKHGEKMRLSHRLWTKR